MEQKRKTRTWCGFLLLLVLLAVFLIWNLFAGSVQLSASQIGQILLGGGNDLTQRGSYANQIAAAWRRRSF